MRMFIEVHPKSDSTRLRLVNINHIVEVINNKIYTDDILPDANDYPCVECYESYEEIKGMIEKAMKGGRL